MKPQLTLVCVGKLRETYWQDAEVEYRKRLSGYVSKLTVWEVPDEPTPDNASVAQEAALKKREADRLLTKLSERDFVVVLDGRQGKTLTSPQFSHALTHAMSEQSASAFSFVIGGSLGLHDDVLARADLILSFGPMTFPHQMMRVVLWEQIYRAFKIAKNEPYHK